jgi:hypothetical protein
MLGLTNLFVFLFAHSTITFEKSSTRLHTMPARGEVLRDANLLEAN